MQEASSSPSPSSGGQARVRFGVYNKPGSHAGKTVGEVRTEYAKLWGIPKDANAYKGKERMGDDYVIEDGDQIEFHRRAGEKG